jgi:hypothetical protein
MTAAIPASVRLINIGFNTAQEVIAGNVDAAFGFWNQEGVQVAAHYPANVMRLYDYGAPRIRSSSFSRARIFWRGSRGPCAGFCGPSCAGYDDALANPDAALRRNGGRVEGETAEGLRPYLEALRPVLRADAPAYGRLNLAVLKDYLDWAREMGVLDFREDPSKFATNEFLPPVSAGPGKKAMTPRRQP